MAIQAIVTDIEGTTSSVDFVYQSLFPYARQHLPEFINQHAGETRVQAQLNAVRQEAGQPEADIPQLLAIMFQWMDQDLKKTPLKALQGMVWTQGYTSGQLKGHVYPDALEALRLWQASGYRLYVYSSGSVAAQKLLFSHAQAGDLSRLFSGYFDTTTGPKRDPDSYRKIAQAVALPSADILFLSDVVEELDAARATGMATYGLVRQGGKLGEHRLAVDFSVIDPGRIGVDDIGTELI